MSQSIVAASEAHIRTLLQEQLSENHYFHDLQHTLEVWNAARLIGQKEGVGEDDLLILELAALFHDVGYTRVYDGHEAASQELAKAFLEKQPLDEGALEQVLSCIAATRYDQRPQNKLEEILCDADLSNLGSTAYPVKAANLRKEWEVFRGEVYSNKKWRKLNRQFFEEHQYHTPTAIALYGAQKKVNLTHMKESKKKKKNASIKTPLATSKSVQVMFKTASRNHIDLTNLADNKANIMLSINAIIITITLPLLSGFLEDNMFLLIPSIILLLTCVVSVIFATMATRPISMRGTTSMDKIKAGKSNLFFFGNFYNMSIQEYKEGMREVINDEKVLEDAAISDLYYLGAALGKKYHLLRTCYTIFMFGMTLTVLAFAIAKFYSQNV